MFSGFTFCARMLVVSSVAFVVACFCSSLLVLGFSSCFRVVVFVVCICCFAVFVFVFVSCLMRLWWFDVVLCFCLVSCA